MDGITTELSFALLLAALCMVECTQGMHSTMGQHHKHLHLAVMRYCQGIDKMTLNIEAKHQRRLLLSGSIIVLPVLGTAEIKNPGHSHAPWQAIKRMDTSWENLFATADTG